MAMDASQAVAFLGENHRAVMATIRRDGRPLLSPVPCGVDGRPMRLLVVSTRLTKARLAAFASLVNDDDDITVIEADNRRPPFDEYDAVVLDGVASAPGPEVTDGRPVVLIPPATDAPLGEYFVKPVAGEISTRLPDEFPIFDRFQPVLVDTPAATVIAHVNVAF